MELESLTSAELADLLKEAGLPSSGTKAERFARLQEAEARRGEDDDVGFFAANLTLVAGVAAIIVLASVTTGVLYGDEIMAWIGGTPDYELIDFDPAQARAFAEGLVALGHPEWEGRMSGTIEEHNAAQSNLDNFTSFGLGGTMDTFAVPMFEILETPELSICNPGFGGAIAPCSVADVGSQRIDFTHREDFVIQGYSGSADIRHVDRVDVVDLGNGSEEQDWASAANSIGLVWGQAGVSSNTDIFLLAQANDLSALLLVTYDTSGGENPPNNCRIPGDEGRCVPYFKSVDTSRFTNFPAGIPFMMISNEVGDQIVSDVIDGNGMLAVMTNVDNQGERDVKVPCGVLPGKTDKEIIFGAHHDTVYSGPGAIDDTSGSATVLEIARQFAKMADARGEPKYTMKFCTWGGEEEGLHGSKAYVAAYQPQLQENLRLYINLDMNHVDIDHANRGNGLWLFGNDERDMVHVRGIAQKFLAENPRGLADTYILSSGTLDGEKGEPNGMPYNSDHGPFVYDLQREEGDKRGRAVVCYGSGSWEYHTFHDTMDRFNEESLAVSGIIYGSYAAYLGWGE